MALEKFEKKGRSGSTYVSNSFISIDKNQVKISFNRKLSILFNDKNITHLEIYHDSETGNIGFKGCSPKSKDSHKLCSTGGHATTIFSSQFLKYFDIKGPKRIDVEYDWSLDMFIAYANKKEG